VAVEGRVFLPVVFVMVVAAVSYTVYYRRWRRIRRRRKDLRRRAAKLGLGYFPTDPFGLDWLDLPLLRQDDQVSFINVLIGERDGLPFKAAEFATYVREFRPGRSPEMVQRSAYSILVAELDVRMRMPTTVVAAETLSTRLPALFGMRDLQFESPEFNDRFHITADDRRFAYQLIDPRMMEHLLSTGHVDLRYEIRGCRVLVAAPRIVMFAIRGRILRSRRGSLQRYADRHGYEFSAEDRYRLTDTGLPLLRRGRERKCCNVVSGRVDGLPFVAADYAYDEDEMDIRGRSRGYGYRYKLVVLATATIVSVNRFVAQTTLVNNSWSNVNTELKRRHDLIPSLVEVVRGYAAHERATLEQVTRARADAIRAVGSSPAGQAAAEASLGGALRNLVAVSERYPQLHATRNFLELQAELANTEDRIQVARRFYNANVADYNRRVDSIPSLFVARIFGYREVPFFQVEPAVEEVPAIRF
jgi:LemA protein